MTRNSRIKNNFSAKVYSCLKEIPFGRVVSYREIAKFCGKPKAVRAVGSILRRNSDPRKFPCYKVVKSNGYVGGYVFGTPQKAKMLRGEGIDVDEKGFINLEKFGFSFERGSGQTE
jgi:O-6-methylguanine DNA methyltransferase